MDSDNGVDTDALLKTDSEKLPSGASEPLLVVLETILGILWLSWYEWKGSYLVTAKF